jgi:peptidoglycan hydrolase-like protein with peptidoglycan-binding domain
MQTTFEQVIPGSAGLDMSFALRMLSIFESCDLTEKDYFDLEVKNKIINFQKKCGITADGKMGPKTWERLAPALSNQYSCWNKEKAVKLVQVYLKKSGYIYFVPDGIYGTGMQAAVEDFQLANGLAADGVWGQSCWKVWFEDGHKKYPVRSLPWLKKAI